MARVGIRQSMPRHVVRTGEGVVVVAGTNWQYCWVVGVVDTHSDFAQWNWVTRLQRGQIVGPSGVLNAWALCGAGDRIEVFGNLTWGPLILNCLTCQCVVSGVPRESASTFDYDVKCITYGIRTLIVTPLSAIPIIPIQAIFNSECVGSIYRDTLVIRVKVDSEAILRDSRALTIDYHIIEIRLPCVVIPFEVIIIGTIAPSWDFNVRNRRISCTVMSRCWKSDGLHTSIHLKSVSRWILWVILNIRTNGRWVCYSDQHSHCQYE